MLEYGVPGLQDSKFRFSGHHTVYPENPRLQPKDLKTYFTHDLLSYNEIPIIEGLVQTRKTYDVKVSLLPKSDI